MKEVSISFRKIDIFAWYTGEILLQDVTCDTAAHFFYLF